MPTATTSDPRAWRADTLDAPASWYYPFSDRALAVLDKAVRGWSPEARPLTELKPSDELRAASKDEIDRAIEGNGCWQRGTEAPGVWSQLSTTFSPTSGERAVRFGFRPWMSPRRLRA